MSVGNAEPSQVTRRDPTAWKLASLPNDLDLASAESFCRQVAAAHYENFTVATHLVPADMRQDLANVYTFARWSDDLADESDGDATDALKAWLSGLEDAVARSGAPGPQHVPKPVCRFRNRGGRHTSIVCRGAIK